MRPPVRPPVRFAVAVAVTVLLAGSGTGCSLVDDLSGSEAVAASAPPVAAGVAPYDSQFTQDGTFQSHIDFQGMDFVYTLYPTKSTPRTNEWYPSGKKYFSFTLQAYDLSQGLRSPFESKRMVYLRSIKVDSQTVLTGGAPGPDQPYRLDVQAPRVTFDPEPVTTDRGMLITSPKGAFELRNQEIGEMAADTHGLVLTFSATVFVQESAGSDRYVQHQLRQKVPIGIFASDQPTTVAPIPIDAN